MPGPEATRFDSWKEIAAYLGHDLRTVRRWEKERALPVHRVPGGGRRAVYALRNEIDAWLFEFEHTQVRQNKGAWLLDEAPDLRVKGSQKLAGWIEGKHETTGSNSTKDVPLSGTRGSEFPSQNAAGIPRLRLTTTAGVIAIYRIASDRVLVLDS